MTKKNDVTGTDQEFEIHVVGRNVEVTEAMKRYAAEKVAKMERFSHDILEAWVTMDIQKLEQRVSIVIKVGHTMIKVAKASENMYASVDMAIAKLQQKLNKYRSRLKEHHARPLSTVDMTVNVLAEDELTDINDEIEEETIRQVEEALSPPEVVSREIYPLHTLTAAEAAMKFDLGGDPFMVYRSEEDQKLKVMYQLQDHQVGILEPE